MAYNGTRKFLEGASMTSRIDLDQNSKWRVVVPSIHTLAEFPVIAWQVRGNEVFPMFVDHLGQIQSLVRSNHVLKFRLTCDQFNTKTGPPTSKWTGNG